MPQVMVLAGGRGTRLAQPDVPKALATLDDHSILWHIIDRLAAHGLAEVFVALGHLGDRVRAALPDEYPRCRTRAFADCLSLRPAHGGRVELVDTGEDTPVPARIARLLPRLDAAPFLVHWTDVLSDIDYQALFEQHRRGGARMTLAAVRPPARFGRMVFGNDGVLQQFHEKDRLAEGYVFGGIAVLDPDLYGELAGDSFENGVVQTLLARGAVRVFRHDGFWQCMDYPHEREGLAGLARSGRMPWRRRDAAARASAS